MSIVPQSLRAQITASVALVVMIVVALAGLVIVVRIDHRDRADVDQQLTSRADKVRQDAAKLTNQGNRPNDEYGGLLAGSQSLVRLVVDGQIVAERGDQPTQPLPVATQDGYTTLRVGSETWRSLTEPLSAGSAERIQVLQDLSPVEQRRTDNIRLVSVTAIAAMLVTGAGVWLVTRLILQPLQRLRAGAARISDGNQQLPSEQRPQEVADLSAALNAMLQQLQTSTQSTRRFTADAGHELRTPLTSLGVNLETLQRNPALPKDQQQQIVAASLAEHQRITALLEGLQTLARGDAGALPARADLDLADLVDDAVRHAKARHPETAYTFDQTPLPLVDGWQVGLRIAVDNLLDNAALHGHPNGRVEVRLHCDDQWAFITVTDDGPGIPAADRDAMKERFARGPNPRSHGSGLGLALVQQQAELHRGTLTLTDAPGTGLRAILAVPLNS
ncbi:HAMP domain-containing sensor histidine kinase [Kribbella kalugense]|uniref:histidine kinase n=1 Tax=Kribbella kalugense TaxID=2512221 RepID=A0A4R7ZU32_9ACTN|nr:HAMP domain-containing sensor histidine kinase [Kribbella kalugense]TDW21509.1 signal transduction histidine kinase [Kribbella kalugense]